MGKVYENLRDDFEKFIEKFKEELTDYIPDTIDDLMRYIADNVIWIFLKDLEYLEKDLKFYIKKVDERHRVERLLNDLHTQWRKELNKFKGDR